MAKFRLHMDSQLVKLVVVFVVLFGLFFYGVDIVALQTYKDEFAGDMRTVNGTDYQYDKYEPENSSNVVSATETNKSIGADIELPDITIPAGQFTWYDIFDADYALNDLLTWGGAGEEVETFTIWPQTTIWNGTTINLERNYTWYDFELNFAQFNGNIFPRFRTDYLQVKNYLGPAPAFFIVILSVLPIALVLKIISAVEVGA